MNLIKTIFRILVCTLVYSCNPIVKDNKTTEKSVSIICLKDNDNMYVRIMNNTDKVIYVPENYDVNYTNNSDTLHFETINKSKYSVTYYYQYKKIFPFEFYTAKQIVGYKPDSIAQYKTQTMYFNQFRLQPILPVKPGSAYFETLRCDLPKHTNIVQAVYYDVPFLNKKKLQNIEYSYQDFLKFDNVQAKYINSTITIRFR